MTVFKGHLVFAIFDLLEFTGAYNSKLLTYASDVDIQSCVQLCNVLFLTCYPHLKSPHQPCGTPHNICGIPQKHAEYQHFLSGILHEHAELRRGFTICGISSASLIGNFSAPAAEKSDLILF